MTNASSAQASMTLPTLFVGVDMAQKSFVWAIHGQPQTHCASNDDSGFEQLLDALVIEAGPKRIFLLLTDILMDVDLPCPPGLKPAPGSMVKIRLIKADALDNLVRFDW